jgi:hypothetical protein
MSKVDNFWGGAKSMLVMYNFTTLENFKAFKSNIDQIASDLNVKDLEVLVLLKDKELVSTVNKFLLYTYFKEKEINFRGKMKNPIIEKMREREYDVLFCVGEPTQKVLKWLKNIKVKTRIGLNLTNQLFFDVNLTSSTHSMEEMVNFAHHTLKKIS